MPATGRCSAGSCSRGGPRSTCFGRPDVARSCDDRDGQGPMRVAAKTVLAIAGGLGTGVAAASGASFADAASASSGTRVRTAHVELLTDGSPDAGRALGRELERFERAVSSLAPPPSEDVPPIVLYAFRDLDSFRPFLPEFRGRAQEVGGFAQVGEDGAIAALDLTADDDRTATAFHELSHLLLGRVLPPPPPWLAEGLAEYFSAAPREPGA